MTNENNQGGIVYVLTNPEMPGLVKIGKTSLDSVEQRLSQLYSTGVPVPFECEYAAMVSDSTEVEKALHTAFEPHRINPNREFFRMEPEQAMAILELLAVDDVTPGVQEEAEKVEDAATRSTISNRSPRPAINFYKMGIHSGSELKMINSEVTVEIVGSRLVKYQGEEYTLSGVTSAVLGEGHRRPRYLWTYNGRLIDEIHNEIYPLPE